jgi:broad specificity phosphatase PhoE
MKKKQITQFILARHGETEWNKLRRLQGHLDSPLTLSGQNQAKKLVEKITLHSIELVITSPLGRALNTAIICQSRLSLALKINSGLVERHFGDWQGRLFDELAAEQYFKQIFSQVTKHSPPNGEAGLDCGTRISHTLVDIAVTQSENRILVITHGDAIRCFLATLSQNSGCDAYSQYGNGKIFPVNYCHSSKSFNLG